ncbi:Uncharacterised protein [Candidatus Ornithobacterium hominis]|uniref:Uncharacterized protein n=1 Tax=Candidatus Ornithobacterium hominis TaxID=2497989 RepID=A0A383U4Q7_9FLAO|nr:hypothetical protein [Candidatus Ornithobacterium hominis]MCT7904710.1 hypothetical protein [Candidatus Ornithobacterium hominis]SZD73943.1 Uncharacterised protein [Candidatus Ornithobacterium hominis]
MASVYEFIISAKDLAFATAGKVSAAVDKINTVAHKATASTTKMQASAQTAFGKILTSTKSAVRGSATLQHSIDELQDKLAELNKVKFGTVLKSEFAAVNKKIKKTKKQIERLQQGILMDMGLIEDKRKKALTQNLDEKTDEVVENVTE